MLVNSRKIEEAVNNSTQLDQALSRVVQRIKSSMDANASSVDLISALAKRADFFSIGTNDLTQ